MLTFSFTHTPSDGKDLNLWQVVLGRTHLMSTGGISVAAIIINKDYNGFTHDYDIAMLKLTRPVTTGGTGHLSSSYSTVQVLYSSL